MNSFYSADELAQLGLKCYGENVLISKNANLYNPSKISIGSNVRIDDFCILSGDITLGSYIHISAYCAIYGAMGVFMDDYSGLSPRCTVFSAMDDFSGDYFINPMIESKLTNVTGGKVIINKYVQIGANSIIFPDITIETGTVVGCMSLVNKSLESWGIYVGIPVTRIKHRSKGLLKLL